MYAARSIVALALAGAASFVAAVPTSGNSGAPAKVCLCAADADYLMAGYVELLSPKYTDAAADKYLSPKFRDTSDGINTLAGIPLGQVTFPSKEALKAHEKQQPDNLTINVTRKGPVGCDSLAFVWTTTFGAGYTVRGVTIIGAERNNGKWQMTSWDVEFNSIAFLDNIGGSCSVTPLKAA